MLKITGSKIELTRGDTLYLTAHLKNADDTFEPYVTPTDERIATLEAIINNR